MDGGSLTSNLKFVTDIVIVLTSRGTDYFTSMMNSPTNMNEECNKRKIPTSCCRKPII
ncbi:hypothetical protein KFK09_014057 [Dendrobium nobile]|uniref:Uncharacterized protein n=1 Tax=Dendrobium nobile TaxID=94219 RepID=A0A8T3BEP4_DENNO|nr:hypothetical protein KFK09_014057 [Dendrobium nobile]